MTDHQDDDETRRFRASLRRALRGEPDPEREAEREQLLLEAAAQRAAWGYPALPPASKGIH